MRFDVKCPGVSLAEVKAFHICSTLERMDMVRTKLEILFEQRGKVRQGNDSSRRIVMRVILFE